MFRDMHEKNWVIRDTIVQVISPKVDRSKKY